MSLLGSFPSGGTPGSSFHPLGPRFFTCMSSGGCGRFPVAAVTDDRPPGGSTQIYHLGSPGAYVRLWAGLRSFLGAQDRSVIHAPPPPPPLLRLPAFLGLQPLPPSPRLFFWHARSGKPQPSPAPYLSQAAAAVTGSQVRGNRLWASLEDAVPAPCSSQLPQPPPGCTIAPSSLV